MIICNSFVSGLSSCVSIVMSVCNHAYKLNKFTKKSVFVSSTSFLQHSVDSITSSFHAVSNAGSSFSLGSNSVPGSSFQGQGSFGLEPFSSSQLSFDSMTNPFSLARSFFNHSSTMGSFV